MGAFTSLKNHFIIATPNLTDPNFCRAVAYICDHTPEGAMAIIVNYPLTLHLSDVFQNMDIDSQNRQLNDMTIFAGGPIQQERGFVLHLPCQEHWESSLELSDNISITTSKDILQAMADNHGPQKALIALGYAGWGPGQLEKELADNSWILSPASADIVFNTPHDERWKAAAALIGVDIERMSSQMGHA